MTTTAPPPAPDKPSSSAPRPIKTVIGVLVAMIALAALVIIVAVSRRNQEPATTAGGPGSTPVTTAAASPTASPAVPTTLPAPVTTPAPPTTPATTATAPPPSEAALRGDGLGFVAFGTNAETAIAATTARYGAPTSDSGWERQTSLSPPMMIRIVGWGRLALFFQQDPGPTFRAYYYRQDQDQRGGPDLATVAGVKLGDTAATFEASAANPTSGPVGGGASMRCSNGSDGHVCVWFDPPFHGSGNEVPPRTSTIVGFWGGSPRAFD